VPNRTDIDYTDESTYAATRKPVEQASTLLPAAYRCPRFYDDELTRVWQRSWTAVGYASQLPAAGDMMPVTVGEQPVLVVRGRDQQLRAFHNVCRHRGSQLIDEPCQAAGVASPGVGFRRFQL
jgi:choline monooxygenase